MDMNMPDRIVVNPGIHGGAPVVTGTRVPVYAVVELIAAGMSSAEIRSDHYEMLTDEDIFACLKYAAQVLREENVHAA